MDACNRTRACFRELSPNFPLPTLLSQDHGPLNPFCSIPFQNHVHYIPCPNLHSIQKILLCVSLPPIPKTLSVSLSYFPLYISFYLLHSVPNRDIPKFGTSHLAFL